MAKRRMISAELMGSDEFLDLPIDVQALYLHLLVEADDDGFLRAKKRILMTLGLGEEMLKTLADAGFLIVFPSGAAALTHWPMNNKVPKDRYTPTVHQAEAAQLEIGPGLQYILKSEAQKDLVKAPAGNDPAPAQTPKTAEKTEAQPSVIAPSVPGAAVPLPMQGGEYSVSAAEAAEWKRLYPAVDLTQELRNMRGWLLANPEKQKTADTIGRFINTWLTKAQEKATEKQAVSSTGNRGQAYLSWKDSPANYDIEKAIQKMNTTVPKLKKKGERQAPASCL